MPLRCCLSSKFIVSIQLTFQRNITFSSSSIILLCVLDTSLIRLSHIYHLTTPLSTALPGRNLGGWPAPGSQHGWVSGLLDTSTRQDGSGARQSAPAALPPVPVWGGGWVWPSGGEHPRRTREWEWRGGGGGESGGDREQRAGSEVGIGADGTQ